MPELGRNPATGGYHYAAEIAFDDSLQHVDWRCLGCEARYTTVGADRTDDDFTPHFRLYPNCPHIDCQGVGFENLGGEGGRADGVGVPNRLILRARAAVAELATPVDQAANGEGELGIPGQDRVAVVPGATVGSLYPIVMYYNAANANRDQMLRVLDWRAVEYKFSFKSLQYAVPNQLRADRIFHAQIVPEAVVEDTGGITVPLGGNFDVRFNFDGLSDRQMAVLRNTIRLKCERQIEFRRRDRRNSVEIYFIGVREAPESRSFTLLDPRMFCFWDNFV